MSCCVEHWPFFCKYFQGGKSPKSQVLQIYFFNNKCAKYKLRTFSDFLGGSLLISLNILVAVKQLVIHSLDQILAPTPFAFPDPDGGYKYKDNQVNTHHHTWGSGPLLHMACMSPISLIGSYVK